MSGFSLEDLLNGATPSTPKAETTSKNTHHSASDEDLDASNVTGVSQKVNASDYDVESLLTTPPEDEVEEVTSKLRESDPSEVAESPVKTFPEDEAPARKGFDFSKQTETSSLASLVNRSKFEDAKPLVENLGKDDLPETPVNVDSDNKASKPSSPVTSGLKDLPTLRADYMRQDSRTSEPLVQVEDEKPIMESKSEGYGGIYVDAIEGIVDDRIDMVLRRVPNVHPVLASLGLVFFWPTGVFAVAYVIDAITCAANSEPTDEINKSAKMAGVFGAISIILGLLFWVAVGLGGYFYHDRIIEFVRPYIF